MKEATILSAYGAAKDIYASYGVDVDAAIQAFLGIPISLHSWQADDIMGFEGEAGGTSGGILVTGNYPGRARTPDEVRADLAMAMGMIPGALRINVHASYGENFERGMDRDAYTTRQFENWIAWAQSMHIGMDFNLTSFGHPMAKDDLTLSHPDRQVRDFWVRHGIAARRIAADIGRRLGSPCVYNIWVQDGIKDLPADRYYYRSLLKDSLDQMLSENISPEYVYDALESKLFAVGVESYTVGSNEFYLGYLGHARREGIGNPILTLDAGHFHPTESIADKISSLLLFSDRLLVHVSRSVRWDSDHVVVNNDSLYDIMAEIVRSGQAPRVFIATDYFDATINRVAALVIGMRAAKKALLGALLEPTHLLKQYELSGDKTRRLMLMDECRSLPVSAIWNYVCHANGIAPGTEWMDDVKYYENSVLSKRD